MFTPLSRSTVFTHTKHLVLGPLLLLLLSACSSGSSSGPAATAGPTSSPAPSANPQGDTTAPVVSLKGAPKITIPFGAIYVEPGATATDETDGAITALQTAGEVDRNKAGDYVLTYSATDAAGNTGTAQRTVTVGKEIISLAISVFGGGKVDLVEPANGPACVTVGDTCNYSFPAGTTLKFAASNDAGYSFNGWDYCDLVDGRNCTVTVQRDGTLLATFASMEPLKMVAEAMELSDVQIRGIRNYDIESDIIQFIANTDISDISPGSIIISGGIFVADGSPQNVDIIFARRVLEIFSGGGPNHVLKTEKVTLGEIFESGTLIVGGLGADSNTNAVQSKSSKVSFTIPVEASLAAGAGAPFKPDNNNGSGDNASVTASIGAKGTVTVTIEPIFSVEFKTVAGIPSKIKEIRASSRFVLDGDFDLTVGAGLAAQLRQDLAKIPLPKITVGPVLISPRLTPFIFVTAGADAELSTTAFINFDTEVGVVYKRKTWSPIGSQSLSLGINPPEQFTARAYLESGFGLELFLAVYEVAGPTINLSPYAGLEVFAYSPPMNGCIVDFNPYFGLRSDVGGQIDLIVHKESFSVNVFNFKQPIENDLCLRDFIPPSVAGKPSLKPGTFKVDLAWDKATDDIGVTSYIIQRKRGSGAYAHLTETSARTYTDNNLQREQYCYRIIALDGSGNAGPASGESCATALGNPDPSAGVPGNIEAKVISTRAVELSWEKTSVIAEGADASEHFYVTTSSSDPAVAANSSQLARETCVPDSVDCERLRYRVSNLRPDTQYCFRMYSSISSRKTQTTQSELSAPVCVTTSGNVNAGWLLSLTCTVGEFNEPFVDLPIDLDIDPNQDGTQNVSIRGEGRDVENTSNEEDFSYFLSGTVVDGVFDANITWNFYNQGNIPQAQQEQRYETWSVDLRTQDSLPIETQLPDPGADDLKNECRGAIALGRRIN